MKEYIVWFEIYGKKLKTTLWAYSVDDAYTRIREKIIFHKIQEVPKNDIPDFFNDIFKGFHK
jgi:hypothetical protein